MTPDNNEEITALKNQLFVLLVALIMVSGTLTVVLYRQVSLSNKDIAQSERMSAQINTNAVVIDTFVRRLVAYSERHPEFVPVLHKNGIMVPAGSPATGAPPMAPKK
jgi:hypothetical protein